MTRPTTGRGPWRNGEAGTAHRGVGGGCGLFAPQEQKPASSSAEPEMLGRPPEIDLPSSRQTLVLAQALQR